HPGCRAGPLSRVPRQRAHRAHGRCPTAASAHRACNRALPSFRLSSARGHSSRWTAAASRCGPWAGTIGGGRSDHAGGRARPDAPFHPRPTFDGDLPFETRDPRAVFLPIEPLLPPEGAPNVLIVLVD